jgi:hypothetical protein
MSYCQLEDSLAKDFKPAIVFVDGETGNAKRGVQLAPKGGVRFLRGEKDDYRGNIGYTKIALGFWAV